MPLFFRFPRQKKRWQGTLELGVNIRRSHLSACRCVAVFLEKVPADRPLGNRCFYLSQIGHLSADSEKTFFWVLAGRLFRSSYRSDNQTLSFCLKKSSRPVSRAVPGSFEKKLFRRFAFAELFKSSVAVLVLSRVSVRTV